MVDLHLHTTASDGSLAPAALVERVARAGVEGLAVTDHDTMAGVPEASEAAAARGLTFVPGVEITAVVGPRDVHVLAYFQHPDPPALGAFLDEQRRARIARAREIGARLAALGVPIDVNRVIDDAGRRAQVVSRPTLAAALVAAGHATSVREAFDRWLGDGKPAYAPRPGRSPVEVVRLVTRAGGITSLAHPGLLRRDDLIAGLVGAGLDAIEVHHPEHDTATRSRFARLADRHGLVETGGSDYHGESHRRVSSLGRVGLSRAAFERFATRLQRAHERAVS